MVNKPAKGAFSVSAVHRHLPPLPHAVDDVAALVLDVVLGLIFQPLLLSDEVSLVLEAELPHSEVPKCMNTEPLHWARPHLEVSGLPRPVPGEESLLHLVQRRQCLSKQIHGKDNER